MPAVTADTGRKARFERRAAAALTFILVVTLLRDAGAPQLGQYVDVVAGAAAAVAVLAAGRWWAGHHHHRLGLTNWLSGLAHGGVFAAIVAVALAAAVAIPVTRDALLQNAPDQYPRSMWVTAALVIVPLGTVLFEEVFFRGVLWSYISGRWGELVALWATSALFAVWHVPHVLMSPSTAAGGGLPLPLVLAVTLAVTFAGGLLFGWLRARSGSVAAPAIAHVATNSFGYLALAVAAAVPA